MLLASSAVFAPPDAPAQPTTHPSDVPSSRPARGGEIASGDSMPKPLTHPISRAFAGRLEPEPPGYVRNLSKTGIPGAEAYDWLDLGIEHRTRWELRDDDYRRETLKDDNVFLLRSRGYIGLRRLLDPFRVAVEFQDSRQFNSDYPDTGADVDENEIIQLFGELFFEDALAPNTPLRFQFGRLTMEYGARRFVSRPRWRNTVNSFDGFRLQLGQPNADWQLDFFAAQPVERLVRQFDRGDEERWFYGLYGAWRRWSHIVTLEPYWFILDEDRKGRTLPDRELHTFGLHAFAPIAGTPLDYDIEVAFQLGRDGDQRHRAQAAVAEIGYSPPHAWKPRLSFSMLYASGDRPGDTINERFERLFGIAHQFSSEDEIVWSNIVSPRIRLEFAPTSRLRFDTSYAAYLLASDSDTWLPTPRRDPAGRSGNCIGQEVDIRTRYQIDPRIELEIGYAHLFPGAFTRNTGPADDGDFFYVQTTMQLFK